MSLSVGLASNLTGLAAHLDAIRTLSRRWCEDGENRSLFGKLYLIGQSGQVGPAPQSCALSVVQANAPWWSPWTHSEEFSTPPSPRARQSDCRINNVTSA